MEEDSREKLTRLAREYYNPYWLETGQERQLREAVEAARKQEMIVVGRVPVPVEKLVTGTAPAATPDKPKRGSPLLKDREPEQWQIEEAIKFQDYIEQGNSPTNAASLLRRDPRTIKGWIAAWPDHIERERERRKRE